MPNIIRDSFGGDKSKFDANRPAREGGRTDRRQGVGNLTLSAARQSDPSFSL